MTEDVTWWIMAYQLFKDGFLPSEGGWINQTNKFIQVMLFIESKLKEVEVENGIK